MFDTAAFVFFCLLVFVIGIVLVRGDDGASTRPKAPWRPPKRTSDSDSDAGDVRRDG